MTAVDTTSICMPVYLLLPHNDSWYHTYNHVRFLHEFLTQLENNLREEFGEIDMVSLTQAVDYHNIVYIPGNPCNEQFSAEIYKRLNSEWSQTVVDLILSTNSSNIEFDTPEKKILHDLDYIGLANPDYERFVAEYITPIQTEAVERGRYTPDMAEYNQVHRLSHLLTKERIYLTDTLGTFELIARENISKFLKAMVKKQKEKKDEVRPD